MFAALTRLASADSAQDRYYRIASKLQCTCGCQQPILKACENMNCAYKAQLQNSLAQLAQRAKSSDSDDLVLQSFVQEYGPDVLAAPLNDTFGKIAWLMPAIAALLGLALVFAAIRYMRAHRRAPAVPKNPSQRMRSEVEEEVERVLREVD
jgi:cytochrome c-type biogenesis protein CcmH/NrfF